MDGKYDLEFAFGSHVETIEREKVREAIEALGFDGTDAILITMTGHTVVLKTRDRTRVFEIMEEYSV
jgi:hypothetical protein